MVPVRYYHILRFLHFTNNSRNGDLFEIVRRTLQQFYNLSEPLAVDEVTVKFKGRIVFTNYILKKPKRIGIKIFKLCNSTGYTYDMNVYLGKDGQRAVQQLTGTHYSD
jgi:hypothetical protein